MRHAVFFTCFKKHRTVIGFSCVVSRWQFQHVATNLEVTSWTRSPGKGWARETQLVAKCGWTPFVFFFFRLRQDVCNSTRTQLCLQLDASGIRTFSGHVGFERRHVMRPPTAEWDHKDKHWHQRLAENLTNNFMQTYVPKPLVDYFQHHSNDSALQFCHGVAAMMCWLPQHFATRWKDTR
jgi:hypothetical protein